MHASATAGTGIVPRVRWLRPLAALFFVTFGLLLWVDEADARLAAAARFVAGVPAVGLSEPALAAHQEEIFPCAAQPTYPAGSLGDLFSRPGLIGRFAAGFLGAGVFGVLFGHGLIGELSGMSSILGLVFQFALLFALGWLIWAWWRVDREAAAAQLSPRQLADAYERDRDAGLPDPGTDRNAQSKSDSKNSFADEAQLPL